MNNIITPLAKCFSAVVPLVFDDSLTYYEQQAKIVNKVNEIINFTAINSIKYADPFQWDITHQYEVNTLVIDPLTGTAYLSVQPVPSGVQLTNTDYWTPVFTLQNFITPLKEAITNTIPQQENGQKATQIIPANSVFFVGDILCHNANTIPDTSIVVIGSNCEQVSVIGLLNEITTAINTAINTEITNRKNADDKLQKDINTEVTDRKAADKDYEGTDRTATLTGDDSVNAKNITETASEKVTIKGTDIVLDPANPLTYGTPQTDGDLLKIPMKAPDGSTYYLLCQGTKLGNAAIVSVKDYDAKGNGVTDDYSAFARAVAATKNGDIIVVPDGTYKLSANPYPISNHVTSKTPSDYADGWRRWLVSPGVEFTGAGVGDVSTGAGTFASCFETNPWLVISGDNILYNLNGIPNVPKGAIIGDSKELAPMDTSVADSNSHRWYSLEYRGANTGDADNDNANVEVLNQVLNITGCGGIVQEIDLNSYNTVSRYPTGLFLTGGGAAANNLVAIDIQRDTDSVDWFDGLSIRRCKTAIYISTATVANGIVIGDNIRATSRCCIKVKQNANNDGIVIQGDGGGGNLFIVWDSTATKELMAVGGDGGVRFGNLPTISGVTSNLYLDGATLKKIV